MTEPFLIVAAIATGLGAVGWLFGKARRAFRAFEVLAGIVQHELTPNGGGSLHDKITRVDKRLTDHLAESSQDHDTLARVVKHLGLGE